MAYSVDLRERAVLAVHGGMKKVKVCKIFNIARETLYKWLCLEKNEGHLERKKGFQKGHSHEIKDLNEFQIFVNLHADYTQKEMARSYGVGASTISRTLKKNRLL